MTTIIEVLESYRYYKVADGFRVFELQSVVDSTG